MKRALIAVLISLTTVAAYAQNDAREINNYLPGVMDRAPSGATGPGVVNTHRLVGKIIGVGAPVTKNYVIGNTCNGPYGQNQQFQQPQQQSSFNGGAVMGAVIGGAIGSRFGEGTGKQLATGAGAATGALLGNSIHQMQNPVQAQGQQVCQNVFETRIVGYSFIAQYEHIQVQGFMRRQPQIGDDVEIIVHAAYYAGN